MGQINAVGLSGQSVGYWPFWISDGRNRSAKKSILTIHSNRVRRHYEDFTLRLAYWSWHCCLGPR
jgi:hypothetical protein